MTLPAGATGAAPGWPVHARAASIGYDDPHGDPRVVGGNDELVREMAYRPAYEFPIPTAQEQLIGMSDPGPIAAGNNTTLLNTLTPSGAPLWVVPRSFWGRIVQVDFALNVGVNYVGGVFYTLELDGAAVPGYNQIMVVPNLSIPATQSVVSFSVFPFLVIRPAGERTLRVRITNIGSAVALTNIFALVAGWVWSDAENERWKRRGDPRTNV